MDGRQLYEAVCRRRPELSGRFVFSTGEIVSKDFQAFVHAQAIPVLLKPFDLDEMAAVLRSRLESARENAPQSV